ncbi:MULTISPECIES: class I SAM-dependent methyltransferase [unclassified Bradyrhizobium]|uniref:SAM-dependent methyltransferase n=1 Tax=unclassified Bradyrhizobium TaxID=2631580 RepID=UPI002916C54E|nr:MULTISPECIES: class I SAM-dependent methyltransferase [unclassified Bradyrhizobium]
MWQGDLQDALFASCYDAFYAYRSAYDVPFFERIVAEHGAPVLELGCGTGRVLVPLARAGAEIVGIDRNAAMIDVARGKIAAERLDPRAQVSRADMRYFSMDRRFALALFPFRSFQELLTPYDKAACLDNVRDHLIDGGHILLDLYFPSLPTLLSPCGVAAASPNPAALADGRRVRRADLVVERDLVNQTQQCAIVYDVIDGDAVERYTQLYTTSYLFHPELTHLLARTGFEIVRMFSDYDGAPFAPPYPGEMIALARKR